MKTKRIVDPKTRSLEQNLTALKPLLPAWFTLEGEIRLMLAMERAVQEPTLQALYDRDEVEWVKEVADRFGSAAMYSPLFRRTVEELAAEIRLKFYMATGGEKKGKKRKPKSANDALFEAIGRSFKEVPDHRPPTGPNPARLIAYEGHRARGVKARTALELIAKAENPKNPPDVDTVQQSIKRARRARPKR